jgi:hypothetical protein
VRLGGRRKNDSYLKAQFRRLRSRHGAKKAIGALAASILTAACHMIKHGTRYHDLGPDHVERRAKTVQTRHLITRLHKLGYAVQITPGGVTRDLFLSRMGDVVGCD